MEIKQYTRDKNNHKTGVIIATTNGDEVKIGFSKCNTKYDKFNRDRALEIARIRAEKFSDEIYSKYNIPFDIENTMSEFVYRCKRYYKNKILPEWTNHFENKYIVNEKG